MVIYTEHVEGGTTREKRIDLLREYYLHILVEDSLNATDFDFAVLGVLKVLEEKYQNPDKERMAGIHRGCGGNII